LIAEVELVKDRAKAAEGVSAKLGQKPQGGRPQGGIGQVARELSITRQTVERAVKVASLSFGPTWIE
jgi:hypothetical protein